MHEPKQLAARQSKSISVLVQDSWKQLVGEMKGIGEIKGVRPRPGPLFRVGGRDYCLDDIRELQSTSVARFRSSNTELSRENHAFHLSCWFDACRCWRRPDRPPTVRRRLACRSGELGQSRWLEARHPIHSADGVALLVGPRIGPPRRRCRWFDRGSRIGTLSGVGPYQGLGGQVGRKTVSGEIQPGCGGNETQ